MVAQLRTYIVSPLLPHSLFSLEHILSMSGAARFIVTDASPPFSKTFS
jgi:hypothetical protein